MCAAFGVLGLFAIPGLLCAQTPNEHASHHPTAAGAMPSADGNAAPMGGMPADAGGMMEQMGEMMKSMGKPPPKELYPSLMALPELTPEKRHQIEQQAAERMHSGTMLMGRALDSLNAGTRSGDYAAMREAMTRLREGAAQLESGIAARRSLAEGRAPREVALAWFKREMKLPSPVVGESHGDRGLSVLHLFTMVLLIAFAFAMLAMYFFKMRRATALFGRIEPGAGSPPPGSAPELAGRKLAGDDKAPAAADKPAVGAPQKAP